MGPPPPHRPEEWDLCTGGEISQSMQGTSVGETVPEEGSLSTVLFVGCVAPPCSLLAIKCHNLAHNVAFAPPKEGPINVVLMKVRS